MSSLSVLRRTVLPNASLFLIMLGLSFFNTYVSVRIASDGWSNFMTGLVYSSYYAGMMIGGLYVERMIKHIGHIRGFSIFAAITALSILLQGFTVSPYIWLIYRFITGFSCAGLFIVIESWLLLLSSSTTRGVVLSVYMICLYTAQTLGQFLLNVITIESLTAFNLAVVFCIVSIIPVCLMRAASPCLLNSEYVNIFYLLKKVPLGFLGNFISGMILSSFYALGPVFGKESNFSIWEISLVMSIGIFGGMALQWPIGLFSDLVERRKVMATVSFALMTVSALLFFIPSMPFSMLLTLLFLYGGFSFTLYPVAISHCCDYFSAAGITSVTSAALIVYGIGCILGPVISPFIMQITKPSGLFLYSTLLSLFLALYSLWVLYNQEEAAI